MLIYKYTRGVREGERFLKQANQKIRVLIESNRLRYWEVANAIGISNSRLSVWLRTEMLEDRKKRVENAVDELLSKEGD